MNQRILTGMRTTGRLHLGHYVGALENWIRLQPEYDCYFLLADVQALTTHFDRAAGIEDSVRQVVIDWLSVGLDPEKSSFVLQSKVLHYPELTTYLSFLSSLAEVQRNPTIKDEIANMGISSVNMGFMTYVVSQAADILLLSPEPGQVNAKLLVPVGIDQAPHIEFSKDLSRRFNKRYGSTFVEPRILVGEVGRLGDLRGSQKKMGKSYGNALYLSDSHEVIQKKVKQGVTDTLKVRQGDPGRPEVCPVYSYHQIFHKDCLEETETGCRSGALGCAECKLNLSNALNLLLEPIRAKRAEVEAHPDLVGDAISAGTKRAIQVGDQTMDRVRKAMHLDYPSLKLKV